MTGLTRDAPRLRTPVLLATIMLVASAIVATVGAPAGAQPAARGTRQACPPGAVPASGFDDTASSVHAEAIECAAWYQVAQGTSGRRYGVDGPVSRAQMASFLARFAFFQLGVAGTEDPDDAFADDADSVHHANINALAAAGIVDGVGGDRFAPSRPVTGAQMAAFVARTLEAAGIPVTDDTDHFSDDGDNVHHDAINGVAGHGIAAGTGGDRFEPGRSIPRGQMASFLARGLDLGVVEVAAYEGGGEITLSRNRARAGETVSGTLPSNRQIEDLAVDGCGIDGRDLTTSSGGFSLSIPDDRQPGDCQLAFVHATVGVRQMSDGDEVAFTVEGDGGDAQAGAGDGSGGGADGDGGDGQDNQAQQDSQPATVDITDPTSDEPAQRREGREFALTFTTDRDGGYVISHRRQRDGRYTGFDDPDASGQASSGERTVKLDAPDQDGTYDLRLEFVTNEGSKRSFDAEQDALGVLDPAGNEPQAANVAITDPTSGSPAIVTQGVGFTLTFTTDKSGSYTAKYRGAGPTGATTFATFPGDDATGNVQTGESTIGLTAPDQPGTYDLRIQFTTTAGKVSAATQAQSLYVTVPGVARSERCDPIDDSLCLFPFPNDHFTVPDPATATTRRVNFNVLSMPRNAGDAGTGSGGGGEGKPVDPTEFNRQDGFSPGNMILTHVPRLDLRQTWGTADRDHSEVRPNNLGYYDHRDQITEIGLSTRSDAPIVIVNAETGERHPFFSEIDQHPTSQFTPDDPRSLVLRPARNFEESTRYIVALRDLKDSDGNTIDAEEPFVSYRDPTGVGPDSARQAQYEELFATLADAGIARDDLYLAWDFTVASETNLSGRMLEIRDDAFGRILGDTDLANGTVEGAAPTFTMSNPGDEAVRGGDEVIVEEVNGQTRRFRRVRGRITVPNYMDRPQREFLAGFPEQLGVCTEDVVPPLDDTPLEACTDQSAPVAAPGSRFYYSPLDGPDPRYGDGLPDQNPFQPTVDVRFTCDLPLGGGASYATMYGHGLLGTQGQVGDARWPRRHGFAACAADWWGMSTADLPTVAAILGDLSRFPALADRAQQGFLNFLYIARAMVHPDGFTTDPAFRSDTDGDGLGDADGQPLIETAAPGEQTLAFYDGNSQGGIMGGSLLAVSPDMSRGILGVTGMNYSTLLQRSVDWEGQYAEAYHISYQDELERQLATALIQMLWDRAETNGYAHHLTDDPLADTIPHQAMLQVAWSDHQVTNHAAEVQARTMGAPLMLAGDGSSPLGAPNAPTEDSEDGTAPPHDHWDRDPFYTPTAMFPYQGSHLVYWDSGNATPPNRNIPADQDGDPHEHPRDETAGGWQEARFLLTGETVDVCDGRAYLTADHPKAGGTPWCAPPQRSPVPASPQLPD